MSAAKKHPQPPRSSNADTVDTSPNRAVCRCWHVHLLLQIPADRIMAVTNGKIDTLCEDCAVNATPKADCKCAKTHNGHGRFATSLLTEPTPLAVRHTSIELQRFCDAHSTALSPSLITAMSPRHRRKSQQTRQHAKKTFAVSRRIVQRSSAQLRTPNNKSRSHCRSTADEPRLGNRGGRPSTHASRAGGWEEFEVVLTLRWPPV